MPRIGVLWREGKEMAEAYNGMLETIPTDPVKAENYSALLALWKEQVSLSDSGTRPTPEEFRKWDSQVQSLLRGRELEYFLEPPIDPDMTNRLNHLVKILFYRQGIETTNGFNG
jgi:hypothetical protein